MFHTQTSISQPIFTIDFTSPGEGSNATGTSSSSGRHLGSASRKSASLKIHSPSTPARKFGKSVDSGPAIDQFVGGEENAMVAWVWQQISQSPDIGSIGWLSPLVLFGAAGVAKSSLASLFASTIRKTITKSSRQKQLASSKGLLGYSGKDFCRSFRQAEETNSVTKWRQSFESKPVLFIDDVQHVEGHHRAEKELKEILDCRLQAQLPSVFTCHQSPNLVKFSPILSSRLSSGLCLEIKRPGADAKKEIIQRIFASHKIEINDSVSEQLGEVYGHNVFEVNQIALRWKLESGAAVFNPKNASAQLQSLIQPENEQRQSSSVYIKNTASYFDLKIKDLKGTSRRHGCVKARSIAMWLCRSQLGLSYKKIGSLFGGRDHSTVINACRNIQSAADSGDRVVLCCVEHVLNST